MKTKRAGFALLLPILALPLLNGLCPPAARCSQPQDLTLDNGRLKAEFNERGLVSLTELQALRKIVFAGDPSTITIGGRTLTVSDLGTAEIETKPSRLSFRYTQDPYTIEVAYELRPGWAFLSKQIILSTASPSTYHINTVAPLATSIDIPVADELRLAEGKWGALLRFTAPNPSAPPAWGLFFMLQNPYMVWMREGKGLSASYAPDMDWNPDDGPFASDRLCIGMVELSGTVFPAKAVPEWKLVRDYTTLLDRVPTIDINEIAALGDCVRSFLLYYPSRVRVHIPWCENDYQVDVGTPEGVEEYKRIMDRAADLGCNYLLYTPANSLLSRLEDNADDWGWENVLWFGLGQKIRRGEWDPERDDVPPGVQAMLDYAASKNLKLMAYAYPSLPFMQNPEWTRWAGKNAGGRPGADTGLRSFQDWWLNKCLSFIKKTGAAGFSFDHWWIALDKASSKYAQWYGCRRILESLRRQAPDIVIDGRQQYQNFGPWTWLAGSYPHPTLTDEQPESFTAFPDLHTDRVSADRQRFAAWTYRVERFAPPEIIPGFITHQSERSDDKDVMRRDRFRARDWDYLGWKYSLLSSIGTAPFNNVVNFIPARDAAEFKALSDEDTAWFKKWLDWAEQNARYLHALRPIIGPPMIGRADGTAAVIEDRGFLFVFNPNAGRTEARFKLDASIGLTKGDRFVLRELYPEEGKLIGSAEGFWPMGADVVLPMSGAEARVLEVFPAPARPEITDAVLFNVAGSASYKNGTLALTEVSGEMGTTREGLVILPQGTTARVMSVNGVPFPFKQDLGRVAFTVKFAGKAFGRLERIDSADGDFAGGTVRAKVTIPGRIFKQLQDRKTKWPIAYTEDELLAPWLGPWRLLLFVQIAEPSDAVDITVKIDGQPAAVKKAYNSVYAHSPKRTYLGCYVDISGLKPDVVHDVEVAVPPMSAGLFRGLFIENVEPECTKRILAPQPSAKR